MHSCKSFRFKYEEEEKKKYGEQLEESISLFSKVIHEKDWSGKIGYDLTQDTSGKIATIGIGYHDFLPLNMQGYEFPNGDKIVGKICMCQTMLNVKGDEKEKEIFSHQ